MSENLLLTRCTFDTYGGILSNIIQHKIPNFKFYLKVYWPIAQTINFWLVKPKNQVIYVSFASLIWTTFLAYMKVNILPLKFPLTISIFLVTSR